jgi:hypothetical protein
MSILDTMFLYGTSQTHGDNQYLLSVKHIRQATSLAHRFETVIRNPLRNNHSAAVLRSFTQKLQNRVTLEDLHQRVRLFSN